MMQVAGFCGKTTQKLMAYYDKCFNSAGDCSEIVKDMANVM